MPGGIRRFQAANISIHQHVTRLSPEHDRRPGRFAQGPRLIGEPIPATALSGYGSEDNLRASRAAGFVEQLTRPIDFRRLEAILRRAPRIYRGAAP